MNERVAAFIDGSNLYHSLEENCGRMDLDFGSFINKICVNRKLFRAYYYNIIQAPDRKGSAYKEQQKFFATLYNTPYLEVRLGTSKYRGDTLVEKGVDIMLATDILQYAWQDLYDIAVLISGDGDFAYALQAVKNIGKHVEIMAFPSNLSYELTQCADIVNVLDRGYFDKLWSSSRNGTIGRDDDGDLRRRRRRRRPSQSKNGKSVISTIKEPTGTNPAQP